MLTHLKEIEAPLDKLILGFTNITPSPTWNIYLDTWSMIDSGVTDVKSLPLYRLMVKHYCSKNEKRLRFEKGLLGLDTINCETIAETWVRKHIELYHSIKEEGYLPERRKTPIKVRILDYGGLYLLDGTHTASILMHLGTHEKVSAVVETRDNGWEKLKKQLNGIYGKKLLYQPIDHPDFADWSVDRPSPHRWNVIKNTLGDVNDISILDVGSCTGYFSIKLAKLGAQVTGLEPYRTRCIISKILAEYHGLQSSNPLFLIDSFENHLRKNIRYDVALVLSVLHHYLRKETRSFYEAVNIISGKCDQMILEMGVNRLPVKWRPELVTEYSKYTKYETLYDGERPIYLYA